MSDESLGVSLRDYLERRIQDLDARYDLRFIQAEKAVHKAEATMNERLAGMNEFRDTLRDQASRLATKPDLERIEGEVNELRRNWARLDGRIAVFVAVVSIVVSVLTYILSRWILQ